MYRFALDLLVLYDLVALTLSFGQMLGPADMIFKKLEECDLKDVINKELTFEISQKRFNRTITLMDITLNTPFPMDDKVSLEYKGSLQMEGGYKPGAFYMKKPVCSALKLLMGDMFLNILHAAGREDCPLPIGQHAAKDFFFDNNDFKVSHLYGNYRMEINIIKEDILQRCYFVYYELVPKTND